MRKLILLSLILACVLILSGCETSGSASGISSQCQSSGTSGQCTIHIDSMQGTVSRAVENDSFRSGSRVADVRVAVTVGTGRVRVYLNGPDNQQTGVETAPGQTSNMEGQAAITGTDPRRFTVYIEALDEQAEDVQLQVEYQAGN